VPGRIAFVPLLLSTSLAVAATAPAQPDITVDCSQPGASVRLDALLRAPGTPPGATIQLKGTCSGVFTTTATDLRLVGADPDAGIHGHLLARGPGELVLGRLKLSSSSGATQIGVVDASGPERSIGVFDCELDGAETGVQADGGARIRVRGSFIRASSYGVLALRHGSIHVEDSVVEGANQSGVSAFAGAAVQVTRSTIRDNWVGVWAENLATATLQDARVLGNDAAQLGLRDRSQAVLVGTTLGTAGTVSLGAFLEGASGLTVSTGTEVFGDVFARTGSSVWLEGGELHTSVVLQDFSHLRAVEATIEGTVQCESGADAVCGPGAVATTTGCPSAPANCSADTRGTRTPLPDLSLDRGRELREP
jgi:hypothetical protein